MRRITRQSSREAMSYALSYLPPAMERWAAFDLVTEDPLFIGLHGTAETSDGRSYRETAHVCFPHHTPDRSVTVVLPGGDDHIVTVLHELGHVIDWRLVERAGIAPTFAPVTAYAAADRMEAFAEAFVAWLYTKEELARMNFPYAIDLESRAFFSELAAA